VFPPFSRFCSLLPVSPLFSPLMSGPRAQEPPHGWILSSSVFSLLSSSLCSFLLSLLLLSPLFLSLFFFCLFFFCLLCSSLCSSSSLFSSLPFYVSPSPFHPLVVDSPSRASRSF